MKYVIAKNSNFLINLFISATGWFEPLIFQTEIIGSKRIHSLEYLRSTTFGYKDIEIVKSESVAMTLSLVFLFYFIIFKKVALFIIPRCLSEDLLYFYGIICI